MRRLAVVVAVAAAGACAWLVLATGESRAPRATPTPEQAALEPQREPEPAAAPPTLRGPSSARVEEVVKAPPRLEIVEPPADSMDAADRRARLAAEAFRNAVKAMQLDDDQEARFKQVLYDSRQSYEAALVMSKK